MRVCGGAKNAQTAACNAHDKSHNREYPLGNSLCCTGIVIQVVVTTMIINPIRHRTDILCEEQDGKNCSQHQCIVVQLCQLLVLLVSDKKTKQGYSSEQSTDSNEIASPLSDTKCYQA
eukprot:TRINITY_DN8686_c0_g1_i2.p1 TRINITY_DN8686_c0_g1~~TRINITY_DN8686_c0_g1_i2.p1  ORF type:complete len:118 (-),score=12.94 TRINITY_DN8686_c0_g1_i2:154-507(-)